VVYKTAKQQDFKFALLSSSVIATFRSASVYDVRNVQTTSCADYCNSQTNRQSQFFETILTFTKNVKTI